MMDKKNVNPIRASETLIKLILYMNTLLFIVGLFYKFPKVALIILIVNILLLLLRQGIRKDSDKIILRGNE